MLILSCFWKNYTRNVLIVKQLAKPKGREMTDKSLHFFKGHK